MTRSSQSRGNRIAPLLLRRTIQSWLGSRGNPGSAGMVTVTRSNRGGAKHGYEQASDDPLGKGWRSFAADQTCSAAGLAMLMAELGFAADEASTHLSSSPDRPAACSAATDPRSGGLRLPGLRQLPRAL